MQRVTVSLEEELASAFDAMAARRGYSSRSEAIRDLVRRALSEEQATQDAGNSVANLSYVYNHHVRALAQRLTEISHRHHDLVAATFHIHLDHDHCLESLMLKGPTSEVRRLAGEVGAERGVRHARLNLIAVEPHDDHDEVAPHWHGAHQHLTPRPA